MMHNVKECAYSFCDRQIHPPSRQVSRSTLMEGPWPGPMSKFTLKVVPSLISQVYQVLIDQDVLAVDAAVEGY